MANYMRVCYRGGRGRDILVEVDAAEDQDIRPAVAIEIEHVREHAVGGAGRQREVDRRVDFMGGLEVRTLVPERAGHDVHFPVAVEVAGGDPVGEVALGEDLLLEGDGGRILDGEEETEKGNHRPSILRSRPGGDQGIREIRG